VRSPRRAYGLASHSVSGSCLLSLFFALLGRVPGPFRSLTGHADCVRFSCPLRGAGPNAHMSKAHRDREVRARIGRDHHRYEKQDRVDAHRQRSWARCAQRGAEVGGRLRHVVPRYGQTRFSGVSGQMRCALRNVPELTLSMSSVPGWRVRWSKSYTSLRNTRLLHTHSRPIRPIADRK